MSNRSNRKFFKTTYIVTCVTEGAPISENFDITYTLDDVLSSESRSVTEITSKEAAAFEIDLYVANAPKVAKFLCLDAEGNDLE